MKNIFSNIFLRAKVYRMMASGRQGAPYFRRYGLELVSKPAILLKKSWGGYRRTTSTREADFGTLLCAYAFLRALNRFICDGRGVGL